MKIQREKYLWVILKILKCLIYPMTRLKTLYKKSRSKASKLFNMLIILSMIAVVILTLVFLLFSHFTFNLFSKDDSQTIIMTTTKKYDKGSPMRHVPLNQIYKNVEDDNDTYSMMSDRRQANMLDTPGCKIPLALLKYKEHVQTNKNNENKDKNSCGQRAIFIYRESGNKIRAYIDSRKLKQYLSYSCNYYCCYRHLTSRTFIKDNNTTYSPCRKIEHGGIYQLESDFVDVKCFEYDHENESYIVYDDVYAFTKKIEMNANNEEKRCEMKYNVLMIGMNSMSLARIVQSMPRTIKFFKDNFWLGFRGYHKIGDNTTPNLSALLTGQNVSVWNKCREKKAKCRDTFAWDKFKREGYVTAFGEDSTSIRNTFNSKSLFINKKPTDHYINTVLLTRTIKSNHNPKLCSGNVSYGQQLLNYALDFVNTYKKQKFFGVFWMDSYISNINNSLRDFDKMFEDFLFKLSYTGSLVNTFVIFLSDQGIRYGEQRMEVESYYDERMPFLFMWVPTYFRGLHPQKVRYLVTNQFRLVTPYDLFKTLIEIKDISVCYNALNSIPNLNFTNQSLLQVINENRTCDDVRIHMKWCTCHNLFPLPGQDKDGIKVVEFVISWINNSLPKSTQIKECYECLRLSLKTIIRLHFYYYKDLVSVFYVVAFTVFPREISYEATVSRKGDTMNVVGPISVISTHTNIGRCTLKPRSQKFCVCKRIRNCSLY